jgi:hypothetical protein
LAGENPGAGPLRIGPFGHRGLGLAGGVASNGVEAVPARAEPGFAGSRGVSGRERRCFALAMSMQRERVHSEGEAEEVEVLASVPDAVRASEPHGVVEVTVDGLGVVAAGKEPFEVGVARRDGPKVLGPVELPRLVLFVAVETDGDDLVPVVGRELVVVVPAIAAVLASVPMRTNARERDEVVGAGVVELGDTERAGLTRLEASRELPQIAGSRAHRSAAFKSSESLR